MKPVGSVVHLRRGTVQLGLVKWLCLGSVPCGVLRRAHRRGARATASDVQDVIKLALGVALLVAAAGLILRAYIRLARAGAGPRRPARRRCRRTGRGRVRPLPTVARRRSSAAWWSA